MTETIETLRAKLAAAERGLEITDAELDGTRKRAEHAEAKLAAAEQERDTAKSNAVAALRLLEVNRAALTAVRELADRTLTLGGSDIESWVNLADLRRALAAAEQDEPKRNEIPEPDGQSRDWSDALEVMLEESRPKREQS